MKHFLTRACCYYTAAAFFATTALTPAVSLANPQGGVVSAGQANITASGTTLDIHQQSNKAVIDWRSFDIAPNETTAFHQPGADAIALNRVNSADPSAILGTLTANGNVMIVNPNGVLFGKGSRVDVNGLIATTADISNDDFMQGNMKFATPGNPNAAIINEGQITAKDAGLVGLVAPNVVNSGIITAKLGKVELASGDTFTLDLYGDKLMEVAVSDKVTSQLVANTGKIEAAGGTIALTAAAGKEVVNSLIDVRGELKAPSVAQKNGKIIIYAEGSNAVKNNIAADKGKKSGSSNVRVSATLDASGRNEGEHGGNITITGDNVGLLAGTFIDASGYGGDSGTTDGKAISAKHVGAAGGDIKIGGNYLGQGNTPTALNLYVDPAVLVLNDALHHGDAGRSIFWSDNNTAFYGNVYARALGGKPVDLFTWGATAGGNAGNGGFVETSGHGYLDAGGYVDLTSSNGHRGTYFLDPTNITIYGNFAPDYISTDGTLNLASNLKLWVDASDTSKVTLTYNSLGTTATGTSGSNTITVSANTGLAVGARIRLGGAGAVTTADTVGADTYTISNIAGTTITLSSNLTTNYTGSALYQGYISQLGDKSSNASNATQASAANMPLWISNGLNSLATASFDGNQYLDGSTTNTGTTLSAYAAFSMNNAAGAWGRLLAVSDSLSNDDYSSLARSAVLLRNNGTAGLTSYHNGPQSFASLTYAVPTVGGTQYSGTQNTTFVNGVAGTPVATSGSFNYSIYRIGRGIGPVGSTSDGYWSGILNEMALYNANLSTDSRNLIEQYQSAKWAIALTPPGTGATEAAKATASDGYSAFTTRYLERLSQSADISLQASNNIILDFKNDTLNFSTAGRSLTLTAGNQITTASTGTITTTNGAINLTGTNGILFNNAFALNSGGGNITLNNATTLGGALAVNAGTGLFTAASTITAGANDLSITANDVALSGNLTGAGTLTIKPGSIGTSMAIGATGSTLNLSSTEMGYIQPGWSQLILGRTDGTGAINVTTGSYADNTAIYGGAMTFNTALTPIKDLTIGSNADLTLNRTVTKSSGADATLTLKSTGTITLSSAISSSNNKLNVVMNSDSDASGAGAIYLNAAITSLGGNITLGGGANPAVGYAYGTGSANRVGIYINNVAINAGGGNILANGWGCNCAVGGGEYGIQINGASGTLQTSGTGTITLTGHGGLGSAYDDGVVVSGGGRILSVDGNINVTGTAAAPVFSQEIGVLITGANSAIRSTGSGSITVTGYGGAGTNSNHGVQLDSGGQITTVSGAINVTGTGGAAGTTSSYNNSHGVYLTGAGSKIASTGTGAGLGTVTVTGTGATGYNNNNGVYNQGTISTVDANLVINGYGGNSVAGQDSGVVGTGGTIQATGTGNVTVTGVSGNVSSNNTGIALSTGGTISATTGTLTVNGTGGGGTSNSTSGLYLDGGSNISTTTGNIILNGTGIGAGNRGIYLWSGNVFSGSGNLTITFAGTGGASDGSGAGTPTFGNSSSTGNITFNLDSFSFPASMTINTSGVVTFAPRTASTTIGVGGAAGTLTLGSTLLNNISRASEIDIGRADGTGAFTAAAYTWARSAKLISGSGLMTIGGAQTMGANNLTLQTDSDLALNANLSGTGTLTIKASAAATTIGTAGGAGTLALSSAELNSIQSGFAGITIGSTLGSGAMTLNTYTGWNAALTLLNGSGNISFNGNQTLAANKNLNATTTSGNIISGNTGTITTSGTGTITLNAGGNINFAHDFDLTTATGAVNLLAKGDIIESASGDITTSGGAITLNSDSDASSAGAILLGVGTNLASNGGNIVFGGGADPATGYAWGDATSQYGIRISGGDITAGAGNIIMNGHGYNNAAGTDNYGIYLGNGSVNTTSTTSGNITLNGVGGNGISNNYGISLVLNTIATISGNILANGWGGTAGNTSGYNANAGIVINNNVSTGFSSTGTGAGLGTITLNGYGADGYSNNFGVYIRHPISTVDANVYINGTGGNGTSSANYGVYFVNGSVVSTGAGNIALTGIGKNGANDIATANPNTIGGASNTGNITFNADTVDLNAVTISTTGTVTYAPRTASTTIGVAGGAGTLAVTSTVLGNTIASNIIIGRTDGTGAFNAAAYTWGRNAKLITGSGLMTVAGQAMGSNNLTLQTDSDLTLTSNFTGTGALTILPSAAATTIGLAGGAGTLALSTTELGYINNATWSGITIGAATDSGLMTLNAYTAWAAPLTLLNGSGNISFNGNQMLAGNKSLTATTVSGNIQSGGAGTITTSGTGDILLTSGGIINFTHDLDLSATGTGNITLRANHNILESGSGDITTQGGIITLNADRDASQAGAISLGSGTNLLSNGGNIILGGGTDPIAEAAYANTDFTTAGILLDNAVLNAGSGNIYGRGISHTNGTSQGIRIQNSSSSVQTTGGTINLTGTGRGNNSDSAGIRVYAGNIAATTGTINLTGYGSNIWGYHQDGVVVQSSAVVSTTSGNINVNGYGAYGQAGPIQSQGLWLLAGGTITTNSGAITVTGTGGNHGIFIEGGNLTSTGSGTITLTGTRGSSASDYDIYLANYVAINGVLGGASDTGAITLNGNSLNVSSSTIRTAGDVTIAPRTTSTTIGIGGATGSLSITSSILNAITAGLVTIGNAIDTGLMRIAGIDLSGRNYDLSLVNGSGNIQFDGGATTLALGNNKSLNAATTSGNIVFAGAGTVQTSGTGDITLAAPVTLDANTILNAGDVLTFGSTVNGGYNLTGTAGTFSFASAWGGTAPLSAVSLTSANSLMLPSISAASIFARTTGAGADITIPAGKVLTASGSNTAVTLASASNFINNAGSGALVTSAGRWLVYSTNPANDTVGSLANDFRRYSCVYGGSCPSFPATGNGLLYSYTPTLTVTPTGLALIYGDAAPDLSSYVYALSGYLGGDAANDNVTGTLAGTTAYMQGADIGSYNINYSSDSLASALGYGFSYANNANAITVGARTLTASLTGAVNKVYNATTTATLTLTNYILSNIYNSDDVALSNYTTGSYDNKNAGTGKTVSVSGLTLTGTKAGNYVLASDSISGAVGAIAAAGLSIDNVTANSKVYDATTAAALITGSAALSGVFGGDVVTLDTSSATGAFADKNVGTGKAVTVSGFTIGGADSGNYTLTQPLGLTANITPASLNITGVTANDKIYDTLLAAALNTGSASLAGVLGSDTVTLDAASAAGVFADKNVGTGKAVTASGFTIGGADSGNYTLTQPAGLTANITPAALAITGVTANNKVYDSLLAATLDTGSAALSGVLGSDVVNLGTGSAAGVFGDKNVGSGKAVTVSGFTIGGADSDNYALTQPAGLTANITAALLSVIGISANDKIYDATTVATLSGTASVSGILGSDDITLDNALASAFFADKNVGNGKTVTVSGYAITGADSGNYTLTQPAGLTADITPATLSITGVTANNKVYDATTAATLDTGSASLMGILGSDAVTLGTGSAAGVFASKNAGNGKTVTVSGFTIGDADAGNYMLTQPAGLTADITPATLSITGVTAGNKVYDGTFAATLNNGAAALAGILGSDAVTLDTGGAVGAFASKNVGNGIAITTSGYAIGDADAGNYILTQPAGLSADITPALLTVNVTTGQGKVYGSADPGSFAYSYTGLVGGDSAASFTGSLNRAAGEDVGSYAIGQDTLAATGNYAIGTYNGSNFSITPYTLTVTADAKSKDNGVPDPVFTYTYGTLQNGDTASIFTGTLTRNAGETAGIYAILQGTLSAGGNYLINYVGADLTIAAPTNLPSTVVQVSQDAPDEQQEAYNAPSDTVSLSGLDNQLQIEVAPGLDVDLGDLTSSNVSTHPVKDTPVVKKKKRGKKTAPPSSI